MKTHVIHSIVHIQINLIVAIINVAQCYANNEKLSSLYECHTRRYVEMADFLIEHLGQSIINHAVYVMDI